MRREVVVSMSQFVDAVCEDGSPITDWFFLNITFDNGDFGAYGFASEEERLQGLADRLDFWYNPQVVVVDDRLTAGEIESLMGDPAPLTQSLGTLLGNVL